MTRRLPASARLRRKIPKPNWFMFESHAKSPLSSENRTTSVKIALPSKPSLSKTVKRLGNFKRKRGRPPLSASHIHSPAFQPINKDALKNHPSDSSSKKESSSSASIRTKPVSPEDNKENISSSSVVGASKLFQFSQTECQLTAATMALCTAVSSTSLLSAVSSSQRTQTSSNLRNPQAKHLKHLTSRWVKVDCMQPGLPMPVTNCKERAQMRLMKELNQEAVLPWSHLFSPLELQHLMKIGEGVYGEVFQLTCQRSSQGDVIKIFPLEGDLPIMDGSRAQMTFENVYTEVFILRRLNSLMHGNKKSQSRGFSQMKCGWLVQGCLPKPFVDQWHAYNNQYASQNICLDHLPSSQLWLVLKLEYAGVPLHDFIFANHLETRSVFQQVSLALATAEAQLEFEHRDLHWGNVLVRRTPQTVLHYTVNGARYSVISCGVEATIIDFTVSRLKHGSNIVYVDLSENPAIFALEDDEYQNEIYKMMQSLNGNKWRLFYPQTNLMWMHYLCIQLHQHVRVNHAQQQQSDLVKLMHEMVTVIQFHLHKYGAIKSFVLDHRKMDTRSRRQLLSSPPGSSGHSSSSPTSLPPVSSSFLYCGVTDFIAQSAFFASCRMPE